MDTLSTTKPRCGFSGCKNKISIIGFCKVCEIHFCLSHRLFEEHTCNELKLLMKNNSEINKMSYKMYEISRNLRLERKYKSI
jgi:predicted nucleic acid binding AN1-type Zn finger protein